ncbi:GNAT family N-acetyltransferase [Chengkuizengella sediminis]|uniref:GNAT family N-acetyltransferase n=1 Tax=Chengkuizengella sediminis TaxID=1885917 RepID=UPI001389E76C|nr:GNAT family N-acetyltransferase [Chengkuizengella sediminis]NDI33449.1 GNAT family N-acetyltransferase [Chengkuizengella sediminis]
MEHIKIPHQQELKFKDKTIYIEGPVSSAELKSLTMHERLVAFREPEEQQKALIEITSLPEGRIIIARNKNIVVGYVTFHYADELERWSKGNMEDLIELGAIEVAFPYRSYGLGKKMIQHAFFKNQLENYIVFTTEYYWHWDLKGSGLSVWDYRKMMERLMESAGMTWYATDDPEICSHPANCLMVRIGKNVPMSSEEKFDQVRFQRRFMY